MNYSKLKRINLVRSSLFLPDRRLGFFLCDFNFLGTKLITLVHDCSHFIIIHTYNNINPPNTYKKFGHYFMFILKFRNCFHLVNPSQGIAIKIKGIYFSKMDGKGFGIQAALGKDVKVLVISGETSIPGRNFCSG